MQKILGTGLSGFVGSRVASLLSSQYEMIDMRSIDGLDIRDNKKVEEVLRQSEASYVLHFAGKTAVDLIEQEKEQGEQSEAWKVNVAGTKSLVDACSTTGKHLIYISTDMVFKGDKPLGEFYTEEDTPDPQSWYARTKYEGEKLVSSCSAPWTIVRIAYPYQAYSEKKEYVRIFLSLLTQGKQISVIEDQHFTPTFIDDLAGVFSLIIEQKITGIVHAGGGSSVSPYEVAKHVADVFGLDASLISPTTREQYFAGKAHRGFNSSLKNTVLDAHHMNMHTFVDGLAIVKNQLQEKA